MRRTKSSAMTDSTVELSVVIPVRNEAENIRELVHRLVQTIENMKLTFEVIFVTDVNTDSTLEVLKQYCANDERIKTIKLTSSHGQHIAVMAGLDHSFGKSVVIMDGDLQDCPEDIPKLYEKLDEGYDVAYGVKEQKNESALRRLLSKSFVKMLNSISDDKFELDSSMFRILSRRVINELRRFQEKQVFLTGLINLMGFPTAKVKVTSGKRLNGRTNYGIIRQFNMGLDAVLSFSSKPVRMVSLLGIIVSLLSVVYLIVVLLQVLFSGVAVQGWPTIVSLVTFMGGVQLLAIGILGEYIGRIYKETKNRPLYIVDECIGELNNDSGNASRAPRTNGESSAQYTAFVGNREGLI